MIIKKRRINSLEKYFSGVSDDEKIYVCVEADENNLKLLMIDKNLDETCVVPEQVGPITRFNLNGKEIKHKELKMEPREIERDYHVVDWHGNDHYGTCFQSRMCYPKEFILPPLCKIVLKSGKLCSDVVTKKEAKLLKHIINMFLELFGYCEIIYQSDKPINNIRIKEVSWNILPKGKYPWKRAEKLLDNYFEKSTNKNKNVIRNHHRVITEYEPDFLAIGKSSFNGYVVYGYTTRNLYVFESNQSKNATYVFKGEWEKASQLTKYDIIKGNLCYKRIVHSKEWNNSIMKLFE